MEKKFLKMKVIRGNRILERQKAPDNSKEARSKNKEARVKNKEQRFKINNKYNAES